MESVKDTASWAALIGAVLPLLIAVIQQPRWSSQVRQIVSIVISVIAGLGTVLASGNFDVQNLLVTIVALIGAAQASYALIFKPTGAAQKIEKATTKTPAKKGEDGAGVVEYAFAALLIVVALAVLFHYVR